MTLAHHKKPHQNKGQYLSDIILGGQDGLVNTLGVILGIAAASADLRIVVAGGLAGAIAEAISMGAVGYTSQMAERDYFYSQKTKEKREIEEIPQEEIAEIREIYEKKGFKGELLEKVVAQITSDKKVWLDTMIREELKLMPVDDGRPLSAAFWIGISAFFGSLIPLAPFIFNYSLGNSGGEVVYNSIYLALAFSALVLFGAGVVKSKITIGKWYKSGTQIMVIGIVSALVGYLIGSAF